MSTKSFPLTLAQTEKLVKMFPGLYDEAAILNTIRIRSGDYQKWIAAHYG